MEKGVYSSQDLHPLLFIFIFVYILVSPSWNSQAKRWLFFLQTFFFVFFFFENQKKGTRVWQLLSHAPWYSWVSPWVPPARIGARKLRTHTHPKLYWFLGLLEIAITVLVRTRTWDVVKP